MSVWQHQYRKNCPTSPHYRTWYLFQNHANPAITLTPASLPVLLKSTANLLYECCTAICLSVLLSAQPTKLA